MRLFSRLGIALGLGAALALGPTATAMAADSGPRPADLISADQIDVGVTASGVHVLSLKLGKRGGRDGGLQTDLTGTLVLVRGLLTQVGGVLTGDNGSGLGNDGLNDLLRGVLGPKGLLGNGPRGGRTN